MLIAALIPSVGVCVAVQAFSAASEIAIVSADEAKLKAEAEGGGLGARALRRLLERRDRLVALTLTINNLATVTAAVLLTSFLHSLRPSLSYLAPFILAPLTLILGEAVPKLLTLRRPNELVRAAAAPLVVLSTVLAPLLAAETALSRWLRRLVGVPAGTKSVFLSRDDLVLLLRRAAFAGAAGEETDAILPVERQMISRIFRFTRGDVRRAMVPLVRVVAVPDDMPLAAAIETVRREGYSRLPVFQGRITDIVGVVHVFDLLEAPDLARPVREVMRPVSYFPESMPLDEALVAVQRTGEHIAVVVDEYGGASGILTAEDIIEEIVGEIEDEYDLAEKIARIVNRRTLRVLGRAPVGELNERFGLKLPEADEYATIGGLVVERLGHIPKPGEQLKVDDVMITVLRSDARAVREVMINLGHALRAEHARQE